MNNKIAFPCLDLLRTNCCFSLGLREVRRQVVDVVNRYSALVKEAFDDDPRFLTAIKMSTAVPVELICELVQCKIRLTNVEGW